MKTRLTTLILGAVALLLFAANLPAGPPLICWPFDIGDAPSLPWGSAAKPEYDPAGHDKYNATRADYRLDRLVDDTVALLGPNVPVLVRMETLRRAALYSMKDAAVARALFARLSARANEAESKSNPGAALAIFDAGYLAATYRQAARVYKQPDPGYQLDGYGMVGKAIKLRGGDADMEFAAALITIERRDEAHQAHLRKAVAGASDGSLLARNLPIHFGHRGKTIAALRASLTH